MVDLGTDPRSTSSVPNEKEASDMRRPQYDALDQALADLYGEGTSLRFEKNWREAVRREEQAQMKQHKKLNWKKTVLPIAAALVLVLGANWAGQQEYGRMGDSLPAPSPREGRSSKTAYSDAPSYGSASSSGVVMMSMSASNDAGAEPAAYEESADHDFAQAPAGGSNDVQMVPNTVRKLIRMVDISLRTETFDADMDGIQQLLTQCGGYVENLHVNGEAGSHYGRSASLTVRVPAQQLDHFLGGVSGYGRVTSRSETTQDMTEQYADNELRINTLRTKIERLTTLLSQAQDVSDILEIEGELADTQYELDRYESQQLSIDRRVDMSYVYINLQETVVQDTVDDEELTLGQRLKAAFKASMAGTGRFLRNLLIFMVMALPVIVPVALVWLLVRVIRKKRKAGKAGEESAKQPDQAPRDLLSDLSDQTADDTDEAE